jgi:hypothetical protein
VTLEDTPKANNYSRTSGTNDKLTGGITKALPIAAELAFDLSPVPYSGSLQPLTVTPEDGIEGDSFIPRREAS